MTLGVQALGLRAPTTLCRCKMTGKRNGCFRREVRGHAAEQKSPQELIFHYPPMAKDLAGFYRVKQWEAERYGFCATKAFRHTVQAGTIWINSI